jgi:hypothetical protein
MNRHARIAIAASASAGAKAQRQARDVPSPVRERGGDAVAVATYAVQPPGVGQPGVGV